MAEVKKPALDWEAIEREYRAGIRSLADIGKEYGVSAPAILKRARRDDWARDLSAKIRAKAEAKVNAALVNDSVNGKAKEAEIIDAGSDLQARVVLSQRKDVARSRNLAMSLLAELEQTTENAGLFAELGEILRAPDSNGTDKLNDIYRKVIAMPSRIDAMKKLAETLKVLIACEREAYGIAPVAQRTEITGADGGAIQYQHVTPAERDAEIMRLLSNGLVKAQ